GLVYGRVRGKPGPEVEKLADALPSGPGDGPADKAPVVTACLYPIRGDFRDLRGEFPVGGVVVLPAQKKVVDARDVRNAGIKPQAAAISGHTVIMPRLGVASGYSV